MLVFQPGSSVNRGKVALDGVWEIGGRGTIDVVSHTSLDGVETVEHVALHHYQLGDAI